MKVKLGEFPVGLELLISTTDGYGFIDCATPSSSNYKTYF